MTTVDNANNDAVVDTKTSDTGLTEDENQSTSSSNGCCKCLRFDNVASAQGTAYLSAGRGSVLIAFLFLSPSLVYLASKEAGCVDEDEKEVIPNCLNKVYGFRPSSLITNIFVVSGILSAFLMPLMGAIVDYTSYRRTVGILSAALLTVIQAIQIGAIESTWFPMTILASILFFLNEVQYCSYMAYLPEMARIVGETKMAKYTTTFFQFQMGSELIFVMVVTAIGFALSLHDVQLARVSQATNSLWVGFCFIIGWRIMPSVPAKHALPEGHSIFSEGFVQVWRTTKNINKNYGRGLRWFLLSTLFADSGATASVAIAISFYTETLRLSSMQIGLHFILTILFTLPGAQVSSFVIRKTNPPTSFKLCITGFIIVGGLAIAVLDGPKRANYVYIWDFLWGITLGWFYPTENVFFSMCLPKGQETELSGFFVYCTQIISWVPPLVFTLLNEAGFHQRWGLLSLLLFTIIGLVMLFFLAPWDEVLEEVRQFEGVDGTNENSDIEVPKKEANNESNEVANSGEKPAAVTHEHST